MAVTLVDFTRFVGHAEIGWKWPEGSELVVTTPPETQKHICVVLTTSGDGRLQATASFYESQINRGLIQEAIERAIVLRSPGAVGGHVCG